MTDTFKSTVAAMARLFADDEGRLSLDAFMDIFGGLDSAELLEVLDILDEEGVYVSEEAIETSPLFSFKDKKDHLLRFESAKIPKKVSIHDIRCMLFFCCENRSCLKKLIRI